VRLLSPWDSMVEFDDKIPQRDFDNFQFVNFTEYKAKGRGHSAAFALAALMEVPGSEDSINAL
jgi:E3 ubiquitin-protein ligase RGLG